MNNRGVELTLGVSQMSFICTCTGFKYGKVTAISTVTKR